MSRERRENNTYGRDFACENCGAVKKPPYRQGQCRTCYGRQYMRKQSGFKAKAKNENDTDIIFIHNGD